MTNHPNRSRRPAPGANPLREQIRAAREKAGLTQADAALLVYTALRTWEDWEAGRARMHPGLWELFCIKTGGTP